jgi:diacylglycerol O-acyltransferase
MRVPNSGPRLSSGDRLAVFAGELGPHEGSSERSESLSREDSARWHMATPKNPMVIGALLLFDERLALGALEETIRDKLIPHRRFRQHVVEPKHWFGRPFWRDDLAFEIREHVGKLSLPEAADAEALARLVDERMNTPLPLDRSPWSFELIDRAAGGSALLVRIHHCIADGRALVSLLADLADGPDKGASPPSVVPRSFTSDRPRRFVDRVASLFRFLTPSDDPVGLLHRPLSGRKRVAWSAPIPLESVKSIARAKGHHLADVLLAAAAGALDRYVGAHGQAPRFLGALLPVAGPADSTGDGLGNHYASVFVRLPISATDPRTRLEVIARDLAAVRRGGVLRVMVGLMRLAGAVAPALERWALRWGARRTSLVVSSLAGPTAATRFAGAPLHTIVVWAPAAASVGLTLTFFGYAGVLHVGVLADAAVIDQPEELAASFQSAIDELGRGALPASP